MSEWQTNQIGDENATEVEAGKMGDIQYKMEQIISERATEEIEDDLTTLHNKQFQSPLSFYVKIGSGYLFSFRRKEIMSFVVRFICLTMFVVLINLFVWTLRTVPLNAKIALVSFSSVQVLSFFMLFFLDPGTLFEDEEQKIDQQRLYCQTCRIYRSYKSSHCVFCVKCVKGYDHHCGFFVKCIGRHNHLLFILFILSCLAMSIIGMGCVIYSAIAIAKNNN